MRPGEFMLTIGREVRLGVVTPQQAREHCRRQGGFPAANAEDLRP